MEEPLQNHSDATAAEGVVGGLPTPFVSCRLGLQPSVHWHSLGPLPRWDLVSTRPSRGAAQPPCAAACTDPAPAFSALN